MEKRTAARKLSDVIVDDGPFIAAGVMPPEFRLLTAAAMNELRDELLDLRTLREEKYGRDDTGRRGAGDVPADPAA